MMSELDKKTEKESFFGYEYCYWRRNRGALNIRKNRGRFLKEIRKRRCVKGKEVFDEGYVMDYIETKI